MFLKLTKKNKERDRLLIAEDAICTIEERQEEKSIRIYTMDGFWYDVADSIENLAKMLDAVSVSSSDEKTSEDNSACDGDSHKEACPIFIEGGNNVPESKASTKPIMVKNVSGRYGQHARKKRKWMTTTTKSVE